MNNFRCTKEDLETLGKSASKAWSDGRYRNLTDAVMGVVKNAGLSAEAIERVVEFANTDAFLADFNKGAADHRYVDFGPGILADSREIIRQLNSVKTASRTEGYHYDAPPSTYQDPAADEILKAAFAANTPDPEPDPMTEVLDLRDKLAGAFEHLSSDISKAEMAYEESIYQLAHHIKVASADGASLGDVVTCWASIAPDPVFVKCAFEAVTPHLVGKTFGSQDEMLADLEKQASAGEPNPEHPLVEEFASYCMLLEKMADMRGLQTVVGAELAALDGTIKQAVNSQAPLQRFLGATRDYAEPVGKAVGDAISKFTGYKNVGDAAHTVVGVGTRFAPHLALGLAGLHGYNALNRQPLFHKALGLIPGTDEYEYNNNPQYGAY